MGSANMLEGISPPEAKSPPDSVLLNSQFRSVGNVAPGQKPTFLMSCMQRKKSLTVGSCKAGKVSGE